MTIRVNLELTRSIQPYTFVTCCIACVGGARKYLWICSFLCVSLWHMQAECWVAMETHFGGILLSRFSPGCLSLALLVENLSCGTSLFHKQLILFNLIRKIWYPGLKEASSRPSVNSPLSFIESLEFLSAFQNVHRLLQLLIHNTVSESSWYRD